MIKSPNNLINWYNKTFNTTTYQNELKKQEELVSKKAKEKWEHRMNVVIPEILWFYNHKNSDLYNTHAKSDASNISIIKENLIYTRKKIQHLASIVTKAYKDDPEKLRIYFNHDYRLLAGLTTAAYFHLTGDMKPCLERYFGGLGAKVSDSATHLKLGRQQFWFSSIGEGAFENATISEYALLGSEILDKNNWNYKNKANYSIKDFLWNKNNRIKD